MGICFDKKSKSWPATWQDAGSSHQCKWYSSKKYSNDVAKAMAIEYCQRMIRSLPHYVEALQLDAEA